MTNNTLKVYDGLRSSGKELNSRLFGLINRTELKIAARAIGMLKKDTLMLETEADMDMLADFVINDYFDVNGYNLVRKFSEKCEDLNDMEKSILNALLCSNSSLFEVVKSESTSSTLWLRDLLNSGMELELIDRGLSYSLNSSQHLIYTRVVSMEGISMTSGAPKVFSKDLKELLLAKYKKKMSKVRIGNEQTKLAAAFHQLYKLYGVYHLELS